MSLSLLIVSFAAGILTVLAPCILPLLPVVIGSSAGARSKSTPFIVIGSLAASILIFTYLLKASTAFIEIPPYVWSYISGGILVGFGLILVFPKLWGSLSFISKTSSGANKLVGDGYQKKSVWGDVLIGAALGPVFSTCSPTYFVILATVLPASFLLGTIYLLAYIAGLVLVLGLIAILGQKFTNKLLVAADSHGKFKKVIGLLFVLVGIFIITGLDKKLETKVLDSGYFDITQVEQKLLDSIDMKGERSSAEYNSISSATDLPDYLVKLFPKTDFGQFNPSLIGALSGGPTKDGIPAIDSPKFIPITEADYGEDVQVIVLNGETETKVYPYNILTWHEIVNDTIDEEPVSITFCPLCGSAIVYKRTLPNGQVTTLGVSGSLLESNMIMYDRATENLWQQSTGDNLAGSAYPSQLETYPMQLQTLGLATVNYPEAIILSTDTGYDREYDKNPYAGYETSNRFAFEPSKVDTTIPPKSIMVVFRTSSELPVAVPWLTLLEKRSHTQTINGIDYIFSINDESELTIRDDDGTTYPFYFEMWFSFFVQHKENHILVTI